MPFRVPYFRALIALLTAVLATLALPAAGYAVNWSAPTMVSADNANVDNATVTLGADGSVTAFWTQVDFDADHLNVRAAVSATRLAGSSTWSDPEVLSSAHVDINSRMVRAATAPDGTITAVWEQMTGSGSQIWSAARAAGTTTWSPAVKISGDNDTGGDVTIVARPDDSFVAMWETYYGSKSMSSAIRSAGGTWSGVTKVDQDLNDSFQVATLTVDDEGTTTALFTRRDSNNDFGTIEAARLPSGGGADDWGPIETVEVLNVNSYWIKAAAAPNGDVTAVYSVDATPGDGPDLVRIATRSAQTGQWSSYPLVDEPIAFGPQVAIDRSGNVTAMWMTVNDPASGAMYSESAKTKPVGGSWVDGQGDPTPATVLPPHGQMTAYGFLFYTGAGQVSALWMYSNDMQTFAMQLATADSSTGNFGAPADFGTPVLVTGSPAMYDANRKGSLAAIWTGPGSSGSAIFVSDVVGTNPDEDATTDEPVEPPKNDPAPPPAATKPAPPTVLAPTPAAKPTPEALLTGRKIKLSAAVTPKRSTGCSGRVAAAVKLGTTRYRVSVSLRRVKRAGKSVCVASGTIGLPKTPAKSVKLQVALSGKQITSRTLTATR